MMGISRNIVLSLLITFILSLSTFVSAGKLCCTTDVSQQMSFINQGSVKNCFTGEKVGNHSTHSTKHNIKEKVHDKSVVHSKSGGDMCFSHCVCCQTTAISISHGIFHVFYEEENEVEISLYDNFFSQGIFHPPSHMA